MAIYLETNLSNAAVAFSDLVDIVRCDPGLTYSEPNLFVREVHYSQKKASVASSARVLAIVNSPVWVNIFGVASTFEVDAGNGKKEKIIESQGITAQRVAPDQAINVWYDVTDAGGLHHLVRDQNRQWIYNPRQVILYHELSHVYHDIVGDLPPSTDKPKREVQAQTDENEFRALLGLPLRSVTSHDGSTGTPDHGGFVSAKCTPEKKGWSPNWKCPLVVATEALGSADAPQIAALRRARAKYRNVGVWSVAMAGPAMDLYATFGPGVARHMRSHPPLREAMLWYAVQPACALLGVAEAYLAADADTPELAALVNDAFAAYTQELERAGGSIRALQDAAQDAAAASRLVAAGGPVGGIVSSPERPDRLFSYLAREILAVKSRTPAAFAWGLEGLALFLRHAAVAAEGRLTSSPSACLAELGSWVARLPLPEPLELRMDHVDGELSVLASRIYTRADTRESFARHLLTLWPSSSVPDVEKRLVDRGFLSGHAEN